MYQPVYDGFMIYAHPKKISHIKKPTIEHKLQTSFSIEGWYYQDSYIGNENYYAPIKVEYNHHFSKQEWKMGVDEYSLVFNCPFFQKDTRQNISSHRSFCTEVLSKITWKKQAFYIIDGKMVPIPRRNRIKLRKKVLKGSHVRKKQLSKRKFEESQN